MDQDYPLSTRILGMDRAGLVCCVMRRWGWSNAANIARIVGVNRQRYADELVKRGYLIRLETGPGHADRYAYILNKFGLQFALDELDHFGDLLPSLPPYTYMDHQRVPFTHHAHNMVMQEILLRLAEDVGIGNFTQWITEQEERHNQDEASSVDAIDNFVLTPDNPNNRFDFTRLHEVELNQKTNAKLNHWLGLRISRLREFGEGRASCVVWAGSNAIIDSYKTTLGKSIPSYYRTETGALIVDQSKTRMQAEPWMFRFFRLVRDPKNGTWHPKDEDLAILKRDGT